MASRPIHSYPPEKLSSAMEAIRNGMPIREASRTFGVPRGTLQDRLHLRVPEGPRKMGPDSVLNKTEEAALVDWCQNLSICGFPLKADNLLNTVQAIVLADGRPNPFTNNRPGKKWLKAFFRRNNSLSIRSAEAISKGRAVITEEYIRKWFHDLKDFLTNQDALDILVDPRRIYNGDETSFMICPKTGKVIAPRGYKNVYQIVKGNEKETITTLGVFSADGDILPPCVVFPYVRPPKDVISSMPDDWFLGKSDSGWMKSDIFYDYISGGFNKWLEDNNIKKPVILFVDGHKSHLTMKLSEFCHDNEIILYALPPNTTHMMQPADVSIFKPLKSEWKNTIQRWSSLPENANKCLSKATFCPLLKQVFEKDTLRDTIKNGFRKCGLYPFEPNAVDYTKCVQNNAEKLKRKSSKSPKKGLKKRDFDTASKVITHLNKKITEHGVDVSVILEVIECEKNTHGIDDSAASVALEDLQDMINNENVNTEMDNVFDISLPLLGNSTLLNNLDLPEVELGTYEINERNILTPVNDDSNIDLSNLPNHGNASNVLLIPPNVSPVLKNLLKIPSPIKKSVTPRILNRIGAISSKDWRDFEKKKEEEKEKKNADILERKLKREKLKQEKIEKAANKRRQKETSRVSKKCTKKKKIDFSNDSSELSDNDLVPLTHITNSKANKRPCTKKSGVQILSVQSVRIPNIENVASLPASTPSTSKHTVTNDFVLRKPSMRTRNRKNSMINERKIMELLNTSSSANDD